MEDIKACTGRDGPALLVIGGSHAMNLFNVLAQVLPEQTVVGVSRGFCRLSDWKEYCRPELTFAGLRETESLFDTIIYHQTGKNFANGEDHWADLEANLTTARTIAGDKLTVWGPWVEGRTYYMELVQNPALKIPGETKTLFDDMDDRFARMAGRLGVEYFSLNRLLTGTLENLISGNCLLFKDANHFSRCGETVIATRYKEPMENAVFAHPGPSDKGPPDERPSAEPLR